MAKTNGAPVKEEAVKTEAKSETPLDQTQGKPVKTHAHDEAALMALSLEEVGKLPGGVIESFCRRLKLAVDVPAHAMRLELIARRKGGHLKYIHSATLCPHSGHLAREIATEVIENSKMHRMRCSSRACFATFTRVETF